MRKFIHIFSLLMVLIPSIMMILPYPTHAATATLAVTGESGYVQYTNNYVGGAADYTVLNSDDGDTSYLYQSGGGAGQNAERAWSMSTLSGASTINSVTVYYKVRIDSSHSGQPTPFIRIGGVNYYGTGTVGTSSYVLYSDVWSTNPSTGLAWTQSQLNSAYFGMRLLGSGIGGMADRTTYFYVVVDYVVAVPTITTSSASSLAPISATLNGSITSTGGSSIQSEGFVWDTTSHSSLVSTNVTPGNGYASWWYQNGTYGTGSFSHAITGLTSGQTYYYRACANNTYGWNYGSEVTFRTVGLPSVSTQPATSIATTSAQLNSAVVYDGEQVCDVRFGYDTVSHAADFSAYATKTAWVNNTYTTGATPYVTITGLTIGTTYYFNVQIENDAGIAYGTEAVFTTYTGISAPTNFVAIPNSDSVTLVWTKGVGSSTTIVRFSTSTYPNTTADGTLIYSGEFGSYTHTGRDSGTTYYYSAWGATSGLYSTDKATVLGTTTAGAVTTFITVPTVTASKWVAMPSELGLANFPFYTFGNWIADTYSMPRATFWASSWILVVVICCMFVYMKAPSNNLLLTGVTGVILLGFGTIPTPALIPIWVVAAFIIILASIGWVVNRY